MSEHRETLEKIAALAQTLGRKTTVYLTGGYDLIIGAGGKRDTSVYPDGTAIDGAELVIGGKCWEPQAVAVYAQQERRPATAEEIARRYGEAVHAQPTRPAEQIERQMLTAGDKEDR